MWATEAPTGVQRPEKALLWGERKTRALSVERQVLGGYSLVRIVVHEQEKRKSVRSVETRMHVQDESATGDDHRRGVGKLLS